SRPGQAPIGPASPGAAQRLLVHPAADPGGSGQPIDRSARTALTAYRAAFPLRSDQVDWLDIAGADGRIIRWTAAGFRFDNDSNGVLDRLPHGCVPGPRSDALRWTSWMA